MFWIYDTTLKQKNLNNKKEKSSVLFTDEF